MDNFGLPSRAISIVQAIFSAEPEVQKVLLYGSRAKGNYKNGSDIDLTIVGENLGEDLRSRLVDKFDEAAIPYQIDLSLWTQIQNDDLKEHIRRVGKVFYERL